MIITVWLIFGSIRRFSLLKQLIGNRLIMLFPLLKATPTHRFMLTGIRLKHTPIHADMTKAD